MPNSYSCESENGCIVSSYPNPEALTPHIGLTLAHLSGPNDQPCVLVARLSPDDAMSIAGSLVASAERVLPQWEQYIAELKSEEEFGS